VICYRDGVIACDSAWQDDQVVLTYRSKIMRLPSGALLGAAGDDDTRAIEDLLAKVKTPSGLPSRRQLLDLVIDYTGLLVLPSGRIFQVEITEPDEDGKNNHWTGGIMEIGENYYAVGSGREHAFTAMECGKSAREAVNFAIRRNNMCRPPVHSLSLVVEKKKRK